MSTLSSIFGDRRSGARPDLLPATMYGAVVVLSIVILGTLLMVLWTSFLDGPLDEAATTATLGNYLEIIEDDHTWSVILNTLAFSTISTIVALIFGIPAAWLAERTDLPGKTALFILMTIGLVIPGFATAMGWLFLMHPRIGILNTLLIRVFEFNEAPFNIISIVGMGWVQGLNLAPLAFIMTAAVFRAMDPALEEAAHMSGARPRNTFASVTAKLAWPGILAASIYIFTIGFAAFDVPAIIGWGNRIFTFATYLYVLTSPQDVLPRYGTAAALSTFILLLAALFAWWYSRMQRRAREYAVVTGKAYQPRTIPLGRNTVWAWCFILFYLLVSKLVPITLLVWSSVLPFFQLPSARAFKSMNLDHYYNLPWEQLYDGMINTSILMVLTPTVTLFLSLCFSWVVLRSRMPGAACVRLYRLFAARGAQYHIRRRGSFDLALYHSDRDPHLRHHLDSAAGVCHRPGQLWNPHDQWRADPDPSGAGGIRRGERRADIWRRPCGDPAAAAPDVDLCVAVDRAADFSGTDPRGHIIDPEQYHAALHNMAAMGVWRDGTVLGDCRCYAPHHVCVSHDLLGRCWTARLPLCLM